MKKATLDCINPAHGQTWIRHLYQQSNMHCPLGHNAYCVSKRFLLRVIIFFSPTPRDVFHVPSIVAIATTAAVLLLNCNSREPLYVLDFQGELK